MVYGHELATSASQIAGLALIGSLDRCNHPEYPFATAARRQQHLPACALTPDPVFISSTTPSTTISLFSLLQPGSRLHRLTRYGNPLSKMPPRLAFGRAYGACRCPVWYFVEHAGPPIGQR